jgi:hypothetical protein
MWLRDSEILRTRLGSSRHEVAAPVIDEDVNDAIEIEDLSTSQTGAAD